MLRSNCRATIAAMTGREDVADAFLEKMLLCLHGYGTNTGIRAVAATANQREQHLYYLVRRYLTPELVRALAVDIANATFAVRQRALWGAGRRRPRPRSLTVRMTPTMPKAVPVTHTDDLHQRAGTVLGVALERAAAAVAVGDFTRADVISHVADAVLSAPADDADDAAIEDWGREAFEPFLGVGNERGDSWYDATITACSNPDLIGLTFSWGY